MTAAGDEPEQVFILEQTKQLVVQTGEFCRLTCHLAEYFININITCRFVFIQFTQRLKCHLPSRHHHRHHQYLCCINILIVWFTGKLKRSA